MQLGQIRKLRFEILVFFRKFDAWVILFVIRVLKKKMNSYYLSKGQHVLIGTGIGWTLRIVT